MGTIEGVADVLGWVIAEVEGGALLAVVRFPESLHIISILIKHFHLYLA